MNKVIYGGSKSREYKRTIELLKEINENQGLYFVLAFLYDCQYSREDIAAIMELIKPNSSNLK